MNIDGFFNNFLLMMFQAARTVYSTLDNITFRDTSLLRYSITLLLLSVVVPMVITLVSSGVRSGYDEVTYTKRKEREIKREQIHEKKDAKAKVNVASKLR